MTTMRKGIFRAFGNGWSPPSKGITSFVPVPPRPGPTGSPNISVGFLNEWVGFLSFFS